MGYPIKRSLIRQAILAAALSEKGQNVVNMEALSGVSVDAAFMLLTRCEFKRAVQGSPHVGQPLRDLVSEVIGHYKFPFDRERAYVLVLMQYYGILKRFADKRRRLKKLESAASAAPVHTEERVSSP